MTATRGTVTPYTYQPIVVSSGKRIPKGKAAKLWSSRSPSHTFASWSVQRPVSMLELKERLGHASLMMVRRYSHLAPDHLRAAVPALDDVQLRPTAPVNAEPASARR